jgi:putative pyruvate formate lyase activating enzyme
MNLAPVRNDPSFVIRAADFEPAYLKLCHSGELERRAREAVAELGCCTLCPRNCRVDRLAGQSGTCKTSRLARVASYGSHFGEEDCLRGWNGSGTIFFAQCNLRCVFCQNHDISQASVGPEVAAPRLAEIMLELQAEGCHNINFVTPSHVVPQILEALVIAAERGLRLPLVYNTSAYDSPDTLRLLDGIIDIYMPDFKVWDTSQALRYLLAKDYPEAARRAIQEMHRQVGDLKLNENGLAKRGLLVRHLVMPRDVAGTRQIMRWLADSLSPHTYVNLMEQYRPDHKVTSEKFSEINRPVTRGEYAEAFAAAQAAGLYRFDQRHPLIWLPG